MKTKDVDIRQSLNLWLRREFEHDPSTIFVNEMEICLGFARVDIAAVNGALHGYEIKSDCDTLERLFHQGGYYDQVFDFVTLVCGERYVSQAQDEIPPWWGIQVAICPKSQVTLEWVREPSFNTFTDTYSVVQMLWKDEALYELNKRGLDRGIRSKPKNILWQTLVESLSADELRQVVRERIKARTAWRAD